MSAKQPRIPTIGDLENAIGRMGDGSGEEALDEDSKVQVQVAGRLWSIFGLRYDSWTDTVVIVTEDGP